ncbi:MAG: sucrose-phosphate phosphatase [Cyanobacteria bacterium SW_9_44_58]|nr:MAG: sucrose-phosphate phosphatase [Cyanobacteria bacterium SW_9_44_58]
MNNVLFISDLDNTLIGNDQALEKLNHILNEHREKFGTKIVYATGRSLFLYQKLTQEQSLLLPDALIASVGTEVYLDIENEKMDPDWANFLSQYWQRDKILEITHQFSELTPQPESEQGAFKISFYLAQPKAEAIIKQLESRFKQTKLDVKMIYSGSKNLDILPKPADKGLAVQFLQTKWEMSDANTIVCGDSGNDIALFNTGKPRGILVGNAQTELREWYQNNRTHYRYLATQNYAQGIIEGLHHFQFI